MAAETPPVQPLFCTTSAIALPEPVTSHRTRSSGGETRAHRGDMVSGKKHISMGIFFGFLNPQTIKDEQVFWSGG